MNTMAHTLRVRFRHLIRRISPLAAALVLANAHPSCAATITFQSLPAGPVATYAEAGFVVTAEAGLWSAGYGHPPPALQFTRSAEDGDLTASIAVRNGDNSSFNFESIELYSSGSEIPYLISGYMRQTLVFAFSGTVPVTYGDFRLVESPVRSLAIDRLSVMLTNPRTPCCANPMALDNIVVTPLAPVPEVSSVQLLTLGLLAFFYYLRRGKATNLNRS